MSYSAHNTLNYVSNLNLVKPQQIAQSIDLSIKQSTYGQGFTLLKHFINENIFIKSQQNYNFLKPSTVLSKVPKYKMDIISPVTADRHKGNDYLT
jgi:hypothetical protein